MVHQAVETFCCFVDDPASTTPANLTQAVFGVHSLIRQANEGRFAHDASSSQWSFAEELAGFDGRIFQPDSVMLNPDFAALMLTAVTRFYQPPLEDKTEAEAGDTVQHFYLNMLWLPSKVVARALQAPWQAAKPTSRFMALFSGFQGSAHQP